jgi:hypothetical protein
MGNVLMLILNNTKEIFLQLLTKVKEQTFSSISVDCSKLLEASSSPEMQQRYIVQLIGSADHNPMSIVLDFPKEHFVNEAGETNFGNMIT